MTTARRRRGLILGAAGMCATLMSGLAAESHSAEPGFATCAAYFFLAARGHGMADYDRLYSSGEHSLNQAAERHGKIPATTKMEEASSAMMDEMRRDWREIELLDTRYAGACEALLQEAGFRYD